jgi:carbonic anhydrase
MLSELLNYNKDFVSGKEYEKFASDKYPSKKTAILTCMDTRLTELLPAALGFKNGDVKIIKNAGAVISSPFGSVMRSLIIAIYNLKVENILVIGHLDCGVQALNSNDITQKMKIRGISDEKIELLKYTGIDLDKWLTGFNDVKESVKETVNIIREHPLIPEDINIYGLIMDPGTGEVKCI